MEMKLDNETFDADEILEERMKNGIMKYRIQWKGYSKRDSTWEPLENLLDPRLLSNFRQKQISQKCATTHKPDVRNISENKHKDENVQASNLSRESTQEVPEYSTLVPKEIIGPHNFWHQDKILELFNSALIGEITVDVMKSNINERHDLITLHYKDYAKKKQHIEKLKQKDTFSLPRIKSECSFKCLSCERNYPTKGALKNHLIFHIKNIKVFKRKKYSTDRDQLAVEQLKMLNLHNVPKTFIYTDKTSSKNTFRDAHATSSNVDPNFDYKRHKTARSSGPEDVGSISYASDSKHRASSSSMGSDGDSSVTCIGSTDYCHSKGAAWYEAREGARRSKSDTVGNHTSGSVGGDFGRKSADCDLN